MKKVSFALLAFVMAVSICGCSQAKLDEIYDDDVEIAKRSDSYSTSIYTYSYVGNEANYHARSLSGMKTVWEYEAVGECEVTIAFSLSVEKGGSAKLVLVNPDDEVIVLYENTNNTVTDSMQTMQISMTKGMYRIKVVGRDKPEIDLVMHVSTGNFVK